MIGQTIFQYEILEKLGQGGMGVVYKARDTKLDRIVALKFLPAALARDTDVKARFIQEAKAASSLDDPHICTIFDIAETPDGQLFIVMAYYDGSTLQDLIEKRRINIDDAASMARQMAKGLATAHEAGIVHRDVKPANVMITTKGLVKILDFGVAKLNESSDLTREGSTIGTASYMSPEQAKGETVDARSDIWSIGAVLYEMLTGERPFGGGYEAAVAYSIINQDPPDIAEIRPDTPQGLIDIVQKALSKDAAKRYDNARVFADELASFSGETIIETAPQPAYRGAETPAESSSVQKIAIRFAIGAAIILGVVYATMFGLGLPDWVFPASVLLVLVGLPITLYAASLENKRALMNSGERNQLKGLRAKLSTKLAYRGGLIAAVTLVVAVLGYSGLRAAGIGPFASLISSGALSAQDSILLTDFENRTDVPELGSTVSEALRIDLSQSTAVNVLGRSAVSEALKRMGLRPDTTVSSALGIQVAAREGVKAIIEGEISPLGSAFQIAARVVSSSDGQLLAGFRESAVDAADMLGAIDRLSAKLRAEIGESLVDIRSNPPLDQVSTSSLEALQHYTKANQFQTEDRLGDSIREIEQAIALDSLFGMAYRKAAVLYRNAGFKFAEQDTLRQKAFDLRSRMTERERLLTEGTVYSIGALSVEENIEEAIRSYSELLEKWPEDDTAINNLAVLLLGKGEYEEANVLFARAMANEESVMRRVNYTNSLMHLSLFEEYEQATDEFGERYPGSADLFGMRAHLAYATDSLDQAMSWVLQRDSVYENDNDAVTVNDFQDQFELLTSQGKLKAVSDLADQFLSSSAGEEIMDRQAMPDSIRDQFRDIVDFQLAATVFVFTGDISPIDETFNKVRHLLVIPDAALATNGKINTGWGGELSQYLPLRRFGEADTFLNKIDALVDQGNTFANAFQKQYYDQSRAYVDAMLGRNPAQAADRYAKAIPPGSKRALQRELGEIWEKAGNIDEAIAAYTRFVSGADFSIGGGDQGWVGNVHFRLAELHEQQGNLDLAITHYGKVIGRWKDADAVIQPKVAEAQRRIDDLLDRKAQESN